MPPKSNKRQRPDIDLPESKKSKGQSPGTTVGNAGKQKDGQEGGSSTVLDCSNSDKGKKKAERSENGKGRPESTTSILTSAEEGRQLPEMRHSSARKGQSNITSAESQARKRKKVEAASAVASNSTSKSIQGSHSSKRVDDPESEDEFYDASSSLPSNSSQTRNEKSSKYKQQDAQQSEHGSDVDNRKKGQKAQQQNQSHTNKQRQNIGDHAKSGSTPGDVIEPITASLAHEKQSLCIEFHVLIHSEWGFQPGKGDRVHICFGHNELGSWEPVVEMEAEEMEVNKHCKLKGSMHPPSSLELQPIPYKYIVLIQNKGPADEFVKPADAALSGTVVVHRVLDLSKALPGGVYRKYDDVIRKEPKLYHKIAEKVRGSWHVDNKKIAIEAMLPKWPGFGHRDSFEEMTAEEALHRVDDVVDSLCHYRVWQSSRKKVEVYELNEFRNRTVPTTLKNHLKGQLALLVSEKDQEKREERAVVFSLAVAVLVQKYKVYLKNDEMMGLLSAMTLLPDVDSKYTLMLTEFKDPRSRVEAVRHLCQLACNRGVAEWVLALPLCHTLEGVSVPFQTPTTLDHSPEKWWGLGSIHHAVQTFKQKQTNRKSAFELLERLRPLFCVDPLLVRAFLFVISLEHLAGCEMIGQPFEMICALNEKLENYPKATAWFVWKTSNAKDTAKWLLTVLQNILTYSSESDLDLYSNMEELHRNTKSAVIQSTRLLVTVSRKYKSADDFLLITNCRDLVFAMMNSSNIVSGGLSDEKTKAENKNESTPLDKQFIDQLRQCCEAIEKWLTNETLRPIGVQALLSSLKKWSAMVQSEFLTRELETKWTELMQSKLKKFLQHVLAAEPTLILTAVSKLTDASLHQSVVASYDCVFDEVFQIDRLPAMGSQELDRLVLELISGVKKESADQERSAKALCRVLEKRCPSSEASSMEVLRNLLTWSVWRDLLQLIGTSSQVVSLLTPITIELIKRAKSKLNEVVDRLENGSIAVQELNVALEMRSSFFELCRRYDDQEKTTSLCHLAKSSLSNRDKELGKYMSVKDLVNNFVGMLGSLGIGTSPEVDDLSKAAKRDVTSLPIRELCRRSQAGEIVVQCLNVPHTLFSYLDTLMKFSKSSIFVCLWQRQGNKMKESLSHSQTSITIDAVGSSLCQPVLDEWKSRCNSVRDGSIPLQDVGSVFGEILSDRDVLETELQIMDIGATSLVKERATQIELYGQLANTMNAARALKRVCTVLNISQPMPEIENVLKQNSKDFRRRPITVLTEDLVSASQFLLSMTEQQVNCLNSFASGKDLIKWLKDDIKEWKELETFVELAGAKSSGKGDYEVMRVAHLHAACSGYFRLLYGVTQEAKFNKLQRACRKVFTFLDRDPQLPRKWLDTEKSLNEFKFMRESLSSVEKYSFAELELINSRGIYHVGSIQSNAVLLRDGITTDNSVKVEIDDDVEERAAGKKVYWLSDLKDLHSKLILISGHKHKSGSDIEFFVMALERVMRLANAFVNISRAGHNEYDHWKKTFDCRTRTCATLLEIFQHPTDVKTHSQSDFLNSLTKEADSMEQSLVSWNNAVDNYRSQFYYLNYFTTPQLIILRRELGILASNSGYCITDDVFALLGLVNPSSNVSSLASALSAAKEYTEESFQGEGKDPSFEQAFRGSELDVEMSKRSCLPLEVLGRLLDNLAANLFANIQPSRPFPSDHLKVGEANLLVVPRSEILVSVLNLYMIDSRLPLPTAQDVILCTSKTSTEEVSLLWRRAIGEPGHQRLFCLAMADNLSYEVCRKAVEDFNRLLYSQRTSHSESVPFKLAIICAAENESKSYIVGALEEFRRPPLPSLSPDSLRTFLKDKFSCPMQATCATTNVTSAALLDHEGSSVRVVRSRRAGVGKTLFIKGLAKGLSSIPNNRKSGSPLHIIVPLHDKCINLDSIVRILRPFSPSPNRQLSRLIHIDVSSSVAEGLDIFLFNLLILGEVSDSRGYIWRRTLNDMYVIEMTSANSHVSLLDYLPTITLPAPIEMLSAILRANIPKTFLAVVDREFRNSEVQRAFQYLNRFIAQENLDQFSYSAERVEGNYQSCLQLFLENCGVTNPSWGEIRRFVCFLSSQLRDCEQSSFCQAELCGEDLPGFKAFVLKLIIRMAKDFATPSIVVTRPDLEANSSKIDHHQLRRQWEHSLHPYLFFNEDRHSMTFVGVQINREGQLLDPQTGQVVDAAMMSRNLSTALYTQGYRLQENYNDWSKERKIQELCRVMGVDTVYDPDETYELTMDNMKKILAIQMRFRCGIPVVIMGETGCGKTRLIRYMCKLQANCTGAKNLLLMKVHGGITHEDILKKVEEAERQAETNSQYFPDYNIQTVLFFDEANTTDSIGLIKEIMCDKRAFGRTIPALGKSLQVIAACNPYRKHTEHMIQRLEEAGLGYHVRADSTEDRLGEIPLRQLVYRVHTLPDSLKALVWDFGHLDPDVEKLYIKQIVSRHIKKYRPLHKYSGLVNVLTNIVATAQDYMRNRNDECSFVSLRDVERAMLVIVWFYKLQEHLEPLMLKKHQCVRSMEAIQPLDWLTSSVVLGLAVCYNARLKVRKPFLEVIAQQFQAPCILRGGLERMNREVCHCQEVFLDALELPPQIAGNYALSENIFMMLVCIDLRIPLFLVGKPGSSKSLAKDMVKTAMKGELSHSDLLKAFKQLHMVSYQCSPLSTAEGIIAAFQQCQRVQQDSDKHQFVSCVVLDEVGLAEDSPRLPLKALHPLLDDGTAGDDTTEERESDANRVAFVGLSNWALDPAKMNRGILVNREEPDDNELIISAKGICSCDSRTLDIVRPYLEGMTKAYRIIYEEQKKTMREFFGLRDFYSLVKMVFGFCKKSRCPPSLAEMEHAVQRNFGGQDVIDVIGVFRRCFSFDSATESRHSSPFQVDNTTVGLIRASLAKGDSDYLGESRYILLLTENYAALNIIRQRVLLDEDPVIIFGSGFPKDQEYSHICRTINRIKICMATGRTVVLLNLDRLYESLYDVLNQYYVRHGGQKFVDLGLGNHRVKCQVHADFRLILIAEKDVVYGRFPIPLINRMEKHFLAMKSVLSARQERIVEILKTWVTSFAVVHPGDHVVETGRCRQREFKEEDAFVGYHEDAVATVVLQTSREISEGHELEQNDEWEQKVFELSHRKLLNCATPDSLARLSVSRLCTDADRLWQIYFSEQHHSSIAEFMKFQLESVSQRKDCSGLLIQVTTHSHLLSSENVADVAPVDRVECIALQQFDTEQHFCNRIKHFYEDDGLETGVLAVQCEAGYVNNDMIASVRYLVEEIREESLSSPSRSGGVRHLLIIVQVPRVAGGRFIGFQGGCWIEAHIDELRPDSFASCPSVRELLNCKLSSLLEPEEKGEESNSVAVVPSAPMRESMDTGDLDVIGEPDSAVAIPSAPELESMDTGDLEMIREPDSAVAILSAPELEPMDTEELENMDVAGPMEVQTTDQDHTLLNCNRLLRACIHAAASRLDDHHDNIDNASKRVRTLMQLLKNDGVKSSIFFNELLRRVRILLHERDERMEADRASLWVRNEALSHISIQAGGTFRRTLWLRIVNVITPIVSEIVALLDCDSNLCLMADGIAEDGHWLTVLWLDLFCNSQFGQLHYDDYMAPESQTRQRVPVESSGYRGHTFEAQFPFSCLIKRQLDEMLQEGRTIAESSHQRLDVVLERLFNASEVGNIVRKALESGGGENNELVHRYLHDFLHMVYNPASKEEYEVVECAIVCGFNEMASVYPPFDPPTERIRAAMFSLSSVHAAFEYIRRRLYSFRDMVRNRKDIVNIVHRQISKDGKEMIIDVIAADNLLSGLFPDGAKSGPRATRNWLNLVLSTKPLIESWLSVSDSHEQGKEIRAVVASEIRRSWTVISVLRLFVEHLQFLSRDEFVSVASLNFYECLKSIDIDLTKEHSVRAVQRFLDKTNKEFLCRTLRAKESSDQCSICLDPWRGKNPISLPCCHIFCCDCIRSHLRRRHCCPICIHGLPDDFSCRPDRQLNEAGEICYKFKRCCTAFFLDLVSVYSFSDASSGPPEPSLVHMLMELVVQRQLLAVARVHTRPFSPFEEDTIDSRPVIRSFLLQLLLKYSAHQTLQYVEKIFVEAQAFLRGSSTEEMDDLSVIFVQCMEDALHRRYLREDQSKRDRVCMVLEEFDTALNRLQQFDSAVIQLQGIASCRFCLSVTSELIGSLLSLPEGGLPRVPDSHESFSVYLDTNMRTARKVLSKAKEVCRANGDPHLFLFLFKQLVQRYGMDTVAKVQDHPSLQWICVRREKTEQALPDFFVAIRSHYLEARDAIARTVSNRNTRHLEKVLKKTSQRASDSMTTSILLALYREVTTRRAYRSIERQIQPEATNLLEDYVIKSNRFPTWCSSLASDLIRSTQGRHSIPLHIMPGQSIKHIALSGLALHAFIVLSSPTGHRSLEPLRLILNNPQCMQTSFFPTMPEDYYMEARGLVQGTRWYECKNGHPYLVMDCGKPTVHLRCTDCGAPIGQGSGDKDARGHDTTQTGHVLGSARHRSDNPTPERDLSPTACSLLRLLLHSALLWASCSQDQNVVDGLAKCVSPPVRQNDLPAFFWSHFELDVSVLSKALGRNVEDTVVVCHRFLHHLTTSGETQYGFRGHPRLTTAGDRKTWEKAFLQKNLLPFLELAQKDVNSWVQLVIEDYNLENDPIMRQLYELDSPSGSRFSPQLWRHRVPVSIEHLIHTISQSVHATQPDQFQLLKTFLKEESKLRALQYLPEIIKLQSLLTTKYHRRLSRQEALATTVDSFLFSVHEKDRQEFEKLILSFGKAWQIVREKVVNQGRLRPKKEHELHCVTRQTPLAYLLPRPKDEGTCSVALVDYLVHYTHNTFLETYRRIAGIKGEAERVPVEEVTKSQLIAYDVERDLMPLVYAHCDYSLAVGEGTKIVYNLPALERQIVDRFLVGRPLIDMQVYRLAYRKDVHTVALFERTRQRVPQESLSAPVQRQIVSELIHLTDLYSVLSVLDIVIGFLSSSGGSSEDFLDQYVHSTLSMPSESSLVSSKIQQYCQLKHVIALWRLLIVEKGRRLTLAGQEPFDFVDVKYRQDIPCDLKSKLRKALRKLNIDIFLVELAEVITLELSQWKETRNIEDYPLGAALQELHGCQWAGLDEIPDKVQLKHICHCFNVAVQLESELTKLM